MGVGKCFQSVRIVYNSVGKLKEICAVLTHRMPFPALRMVGSRWENEKATSPKSYNLSFGQYLDNDGKNQPRCASNAKFDWRLFLSTLIFLSEWDAEPNTSKDHPSLWLLILVILGNVNLDHTL